MTSTGDDAVGEWIQRKNTKAPDPMNKKEAGDTKVEQTPETNGVWVVARADDVIVARSQHCQLANKRFYFPVQDCMRKHFELSNKEWR